MGKCGKITAVLIAFAGCAILCGGCGSGTVDEDAWARGLIVKIDGPEEPPPPPPGKWVRQTPAAGPLGR